MRYIYQGVAKDGNGKVLQSATVSVFLAGTTTVADVYLASSGGVSVNSVTSDTLGYFSFWVETVDYDSESQLFKIIISKTRFRSDSYDNLSIFTGDITNKNPEWYLAVGDGVTDDTDALNFMFAAKTANSIINLSSGVVYLCDNLDTITGIDRFTINGNGASLKATVGAGSGSGLGFSSCNKLTIDNIIFDRQQSYTSGTARDGIHLVGCEDAKITNNDFSESGTGVAAGEGSHRLYMSGNKQKSRLDYTAPNLSNKLLAQYMVTLGNPADTLWNDDCIIENNWCLNVSRLLYAGKANRTKTKFNFLYYPYDSGIYYDASIGGNIIGNIVIGAGKDAIKAINSPDNATGFNRCIISLNEVYGCSVNIHGFGIQVVGSHFSVTGNIFKSLASGSVIGTQNGIGIRGSDVTVTGNTIIGTGITQDNGIYIDPLYTNISNINASSNTISLIQFGVNVVDSSATGNIATNIKISENVVDKAERCITVGAVGLSDIDISSNKVSQYSEFGIHSSLGDNINIKNNDSNNSSAAYFIRSFDTTNVSIVGNSSDGTETYFFRIDSGLITMLGNTRAGTPIFTGSVLGAAVAGATNGTTAGKAKTVNTIKYSVISSVYSKSASDDLWDLTGVSTGGSEYKKVLLCISSAGSGVIVDGVAAASQTTAKIPIMAIHNQSLCAVAIVEIPNNYSGGSLSGFTFYDILGNWSNNG